MYSDEEESEDSQSEGVTTSDEDEGDSSDDEEQYMVGADEFLEQVHKRKKLRNHNVDKRLGSRGIFENKRDSMMKKWPP